MDNSYDKLTTEQKKSIIRGNFIGDKIQAYGITHYKYEDCLDNNLTEINGQFVHKKCAEAFLEMQKKACSDGIFIEIVSGFRSSKYQIDIFKKNFNGSETPSDESMKNRMKYSAPSGFSEHHTGLAIDINETEDTFANTKAYAWLLNNAQSYGFEMSFPQNNHQGLGFEPWHWRYVGTNEEFAFIFKQARI